MTDFTGLVDLAAERLGGAALLANDEFFAPKENLLRVSPPLWIEDRYTERGKWMDGWETRRRRTPGYDWCIIRLGLPGIVQGVQVDTSYFRGNYPEHCSLEGCELPGVPAPEQLISGQVEWFELLPRAPLEGDARNLFPVEVSRRCTHLRLNIFPDGGVARLRVHGTVVPDWDRLARWGEIDLAAVENGGLVLAASDMFFGHRHNLIMPGRSTHMGDGWETRRRRGPGHDWTILRLGRSGVIHRIELDTDHFKGNAPASCSLDGCAAGGASAEEVTRSEELWRVLLQHAPLQPNARHRFEHEVQELGPIDHVRLNIFPDGGVARLRVYGALGPHPLTPSPARERGGDGA